MQPPGACRPSGLSRARCVDGARTSVQVRSGFVRARPACSGLLRALPCMCPCVRTCDRRAQAARWAFARPHMPR
eukprot:10884398-Alexandrium_andersonii.AAC.1